ncbi:hypothetical protein [Salinicola endophyticus]|uniref:hypothetical protein n=1 Tax=Salinicola endophyticus TaxID=1949083 RepID=UPI000DA24AFB|nr:hypothetical protein [Salinicola endophyticus]
MATVEASAGDRDTHIIGLRAAVKILEKWGATPQQRVDLLQISSDTYSRAIGADQDRQVSLNSDQMTRVSLVLNIHAALRALFENPANVYGYITMPNHNPGFRGRTPLESMALEGLKGMQKTFDHINALGDGQ